MYLEITSNLSIQKCEFKCFQNLFLGKSLFQKISSKEYWFRNNITNIVSRNAINNKKWKGTEEWKYYCNLISEANDTCARVSESDILPADTRNLMEKFRNWLLISWLDIFIPLLVVITFF